VGFYFFSGHGEGGREDMGILKTCISSTTRGTHCPNFYHHRLILPAIELHKIGIL